MESYYQSTRSLDNTKTAKQAILQGIAEDGGLYVLPGLKDIKIDMNQILQQDYLQNARSILKPLLPDFSEEELEDCVDKAYTGTFASDAVTPVKKVGNVYVLELFHGPTSAFKDVALTLLPQLMSKALDQSDEKVLILTATSGDTGKAALSGFMDVPRTGICVFYPDQKVSAMQYKQMVTQQGSNVEVYGIEGNFDDAQTEVKKLFLNEELAAKAAAENIRLSSANSINIGRLVPQIVYYFDAYKQLVNNKVIKPGEKISFSVPTGNFGDVLAGYYAYLMGLPVKKFYVASNANNVLTEFLTTGIYDKNRPFIQTISPSMDILVSSNLERLLYYMADGDTKKVASWMEDLKNTGRYDVGADMLARMQELFGAGYCDDDRTREVIKDVYEKTGYVLDPHSAIGYALADEAAARGDVVVSLATASPYKFSSDVLKALGADNDIDIDSSDPWKALKKLSKINEDLIPAGLAGLEEAEVLHDKVLKVPEMEAAVEEGFRELFG